MCKKCNNCKSKKKQKCIIKCVPISSSLDIAGYTTYGNSNEESGSGGAAIVIVTD